MVRPKALTTLDFVLLLCVDKPFNRCYAHVLQVTVVRRNGADGRVTVEYSTKDGSASAGTHFKKVEGTLVFNAGALGVGRCGEMWRGIGTGR